MHVFLALDLLSPNWGLLFWKTIVFGVTFWILYKYAWGPITKALKEREDTIDNSIQRAERALTEAREVQADNERARREAEQQAQRLLRTAREQADHLRDEEVQKTREQIQQMRDQAGEAHRGEPLWGEPHQGEAHRGVPHLGKPH